MAAFAHIPTRRLWAQEDKGNDDQCRQHGRRHHQTPIQTLHVGTRLHVVKDQVSNVAKHDAKCCPHLPLHDQRASNPRRSGFGGVNGDRCGLGPNAQTKSKTGDEHVPPCVGKRLPKTSQGRKGACNEDGASSAKQVIVRDGQPTPDERTAKVGRRIEETQEPCGPGILPSNAKLCSVENLCAVDYRFVFVMVSSTIVQWNCSTYPFPVRRRRSSRG